VTVSERCRLPEPEICGDTTNAITVRLAATIRDIDSFARSSGSWLIAAASEP
jgi:hypothetical protein